MTFNPSIAGKARYQTVGTVIGPVIATIMLMSDAPDGLSEAGWTTAACGVLMAIWWATEAVPIAVTALIPIIAFPLLGIASIEDTVRPYSNKVIFLFLGGFIVAFAMQRWDLHRRIALNVLQVAGGNGRSLVGGFMLASALCSMWISNTATTLMLLPVALAVAGGAGDGDNRLAGPLLLGIAYAASIGGMATPIGTPPNVIFMSH